MLLEFMKRVVDCFENDAYHGGVVRSDYGIIAVAALFEEHCRKNAKPFAYQDARSIAEDRRCDDANGFSVKGGGGGGGGGDVEGMCGGVSFFWISLRPFSSSFCSNGYSRHERF